MRFRRQVPLELTVEPRHESNVGASVSQSVSQLVSQPVCQTRSLPVLAPLSVWAGGRGAECRAGGLDTLGRVAVAARSLCRQGGRCFFSAAPPFKPTRSTSEGLLFNSINSWLPVVCGRKNA